MTLGFEIVTLFPDLFGDFLRSGLMEKALRQESVRVRLHNLRDWAKDERGSVDDRPFGGGDGMVMACEPLGNALADIRALCPEKKVIYLTPQGAPFTAARARTLAAEGGAILLCGRYSGIDERVRTLYVDEEVSIGDYVLMGGELPAMVVMEAATRFVPGVLGNEDSVNLDSFEQGLLEGPLYTRPRVYKNVEVPEVLLSGNHEAIDRWRMQQASERTRLRRPDLSMLEKPKERVA